MKGWLKGGFVGIILYILISIVPFYFYFAEPKFGNDVLLIVPFQLLFFFVAGATIFSIYKKQLSTWLKGGFIGIVVFVFFILNHHFILSSLSQIINLFSELFYSIIGDWMSYDPDSYRSRISYTGVILMGIIFFITGSLIGFLFKASDKEKKI